MRAHTLPPPSGSLMAFLTVLRIRDVYPGSEFSIPDPGSTTVKKILNPGNGSASKNASILTQKKFFQALGKIRIRIPDLDFLPIPDPGVKKAPGPGSGSAALLYNAS
jgi:hypothetical protein